MRDSLRALFELNGSNKNSCKPFFVFYTPKTFFFFIADQTRSKWEPVLRDTFKIFSNAPPYNFLPNILSSFTGKNILFVWIKLEMNKNQMNNQFIIS